MSIRSHDWIEEGRSTIEALVARTPRLKGQRLAVVLGGSAVTPYADAFSGLDLFVFGFGASGSRWEDGLMHKARAGGRRFDYQTRSWEAFEADLARYDNDALYLRRYGLVCWDPQNLLAERWAVPYVVPPEAWLAKAEAHYTELRRRQASLAWSIRRGQPFPIFDNLFQVLSLALGVAVLLEQEPLPPRKWLMQAAFRTPAGRRLRPLAFDLFEHLGDVVSLGGDLQPRHNRLYALAQQIQGVAVEALEAAGGRVPAGRLGEITT